MPVQIRRLTPGEFTLLVPHLVDIYLAAMEYDPQIRDQRIRVWKDEVTWPGFTAIAAVDGDDVVGIAYGFLGSRERWWDRQLVHAMRGCGQLSEQQRAILDSYFEVAEVHVAPGRQGAGIGAALLEELLRHAPAKWALLSTPEVENEANHAFHLYRRFGFSDIARGYRYPGDQRPFAILGRRLPLEVSDIGNG